MEDFHRRLGRILWDKAGMARSAEGLTEARDEIAELRDRFWTEASVPGSAADLNKRAGARRPRGRLPGVRGPDRAGRPAP